MSDYSLLISSLAFALSVFTFYWTSLRHKKAFFLVRIDSFGGPIVPQFALINGGNKDILVTKLACGFENKDGQSWSYPAQRIEFSESNSFLIHAGKGIHCKVVFLEKFTPAFTHDGKQEVHGKMTLYSMDVVIDIEWIQPNGNTYKKSVKILKYGFDEHGNITMSIPLGKKFDLHEASASSSISPKPTASD